MKKSNMVLALSAVLLSISTLAGAEEGTVSVGTGYNYSSGTYGTSQTTRISTIPFDLGYAIGAWTFKLDVPFINISGPSNVIPGIGPVNNKNPKSRGLGSTGTVTPGTASTVTSGSASGLGDVVTSATYNVFNDSAAQFGIDLGGKIKFGTADKNKGLGTGENDYGVEIDAYKKVNSTTIFGGVGYTKLGSSQNIQLKNVLNASIGASLALNEASSVGVSFDYRQRSSDSGFSRREATAFYTLRASKAWKTQLYLLKGFSDGSPDFGAGLTATYSF